MTNQELECILEDYTNKKSRKVTKSKSILRKCIGEVDENTQHQILCAFLLSGRSDRTWAYNFLLNNWNDYFKTFIQSLWEEFHDYECSWLIIHYFDEDYLVAHFDELSKGRNYYFLCRRLVHRQGFVIDKSLLLTNDYLTLLVLTQGTLSDDDAVNAIVESLHDICFDTFPVSYLRSKGDVLNPLSVQDLYFKYAKLKQLRKDELVEKIKHWDYETKKEMQDTPELIMLDNIPLERDDYYTLRYNMSWRILAHAALKLLLVLNREDLIDSWSENCSRLK